MMLIKGLTAWLSLAWRIWFDRVIIGAYMVSLFVGRLLGLAAIVTSMGIQAEKSGASKPRSAGM